MAQEIRIDPPVLEAVSRDSRDIQREIGEAVANGPPRGGVMRDAVPATEAAADGLRGSWLTARALRQLLQKQGDDLSRLSRRMEAIAEAMAASAAAYRRNESSSTDLFRRAEGPIGPR